MILVEIANEQELQEVDCDLLEQGIRAVLQGEAITTAHISLAVVDDSTIHELNRKFLQHDYPTDVLSFLLNDDTDPIDGEVIVSVATAKREAIRFGWDTIDELLLYVVHGTLHLVGYDDRSDELQGIMRRKERHYLGHLGRQPNYDEHGQRSAAAPSVEPEQDGE